MGAADTPPSSRGRRAQPWLSCGQCSAHPGQGPPTPEGRRRSTKQKEGSWDPCALLAGGCGGWAGGLPDRGRRELSHRHSEQTLLVAVALGLCSLSSHWGRALASPVGPLRAAGHAVTGWPVCCLVLCGFLYKNILLALAPDSWAVALEPRPEGSPLTRLLPPSVARQPSCIGHAVAPWREVPAEGQQAEREGSCRRRGEGLSGACGSVGRAGGGARVDFKPAPGSP